MRSSKPTGPNVIKPAKAKQPAAHRRVTSSLPWKLRSSSHQQTGWLGQVLGHTLRGGETIALYGPLGAGKTALVRGIAQGLGASPTAVTSPTFVVIHEYQGRLPLAHMDWYRIRSLRELESTGVMEYFSGQTVTTIEWADKGLDLLPQDRIEVTLSHRTAQSRSIQLHATGPTSEAVLTRARKTHQAPPHQGSDKKGTTRS